MNAVIISTESTRLIAMFFAGLGGGCILGSTAKLFAEGNMADGMFRVGLALGLFAIIFMLRATMPAA